MAVISFPNDQIKLVKKAVAQSQNISKPRPLDVGFDVSSLSNEKHLSKYSAHDLQSRNSKHESVFSKISDSQHLIA